jgi:hypothetical protein
MDAYFIEVKNVADKMEEVNFKLLKDVMVYSIIKNLLKEYDVFHELQQDKQQLPISIYKELKSKLL